MITMILFWLILKQRHRVYLKLHRSNRKIEGYDERLSNTNFEKCARFCKEKAGCFGFAYDKKHNICYPSKSSLLGRPVDDKTLYKDEYTPKHTVCNKGDPIVEPEVAPPFNQRRMNSVYACSEEQGLQPQWYLHTHKRFDNIGEGSKIDEIFNIDEYDVVPYDWPINKYDADKLDYLIEQRIKNRLDDETITSLKRIEEPRKDQMKKVVKKADFIEPPKVPPLDFGLERVRNYAKGVVREVTAFPKRSEYDYGNINLESFTPNLFSSKINQNVIYDAYDDFNAGEYLREYKCLSKIPLNACLDYCSGKDSCVAVEHNPQFGNRRNVCCPYRTVGRFEPRKPFHVNGKFYVKNIQNGIDGQNGPMINLKQNVNTKDIIYTCQIGGSR